MMIRRHLDGDAEEPLKTATGEWQYDDPVEHVAALDMLVYRGIDLAAIDDWLLSDGWNPAAQQSVMDRRDRMVRSMIEGNDEAVNDLGELLHQRMDASRRNDYVLPLARRGKVALEEGVQRVVDALVGAGKSVEWAEAVMKAIKAADPDKGAGQMSKDLKKLGIDVSPTTIRRYRKKL